MKKILHILSALVFGMVSCSQEIEIPDSVPADCIILNVYNSPMTKAITDLSGTEYERQLNRLDCFFYPKGRTGEACVYYQKVEYSTPADRSASIPFYVDESVIEAIFPSQNECDVFIIANLPDGTYAKGQAGTDVPTLSNKVLTLGGERDAVGKPFVMAGLDVATKGNENNASGTIPLHRAAAKITVSVSIPAQIQITSGEATETMVPVLTNDKGEVTLKTAFHNGVNKTYLRSDYSSKIKAEDFIHTAKAGYDFVVETPATESVPAKYLYTCEIPFYTYARAWEKGAEDAAYLTFEMPWTNQEDQSTQTYYYQILINGSGRNFSPNNWYDLTVNVGVIGSTVESEPVPLKDLSYYILDWTTEPESDTGDRYEDVDIQKYTYLVVPEKRIEMNNTTVGKLPFDASHNIMWELEYPTDPDIVAGFDDQEKIYNTQSLAAYYINCGVARNESPKAQTMSDVSKDSFKVSDKGTSLDFVHPLPDKVYSPIYVHLKVWLDINGNGKLDTDDESKEGQFVEYVTFVQYPPIYITPHPTTEYSIYMNGYNFRNAQSAQTYKASDSGVSYNLGYAKGSDDGVYMYTINVTSFNKDDDFEYYGEELKYIIGDPRSRVSDIHLNNDNSDMTRFWKKDAQGVNPVYAIDLNENGEYVRDSNGKFQYSTGKRALTYYYPTSTEGEVYRVIAPKFRIVSFCSSGGSTITPEGAKMRCASFQENGYPAGRWRLPTTAEISFIIGLANETPSAIQPLFYGSNYYYSSTDRVQNNNQVVMEKIPNNNTQTGSVRCVYDEWYWGSEQEAMRNPAANPADGEEYLFTWGDKKIW